MVVKVEKHPLEMRFQYSSFEVAQTAERVSIYFRLGVLCHHQSVFIVQVGQTERVLRHIVEELLLCFQVVLYCFMIVQMIACQVGEDAAGKFQSADSFCAMECELTSMKTYLQPLSAMRPNKRFNVIGSGVVCSVGMASSSI